MTTPLIGNCYALKGDVKHQQRVTKGVRAYGEAMKGDEDVLKGDEKALKGATKSFTSDGKELKGNRCVKGRRESVKCATKSFTSDGKELKGNREKSKMDRDALKVD